MERQGASFTLNITIIDCTAQIVNNSANVSSRILSGWIVTPLRLICYEVLKEKARGLSPAGFEFPFSRDRQLSGSTAIDPWNVIEVLVPCGGRHPTSTPASSPDRFAKGFDPAARHRRRRRRHSCGCGRMSRRRCCIRRPTLRRPSNRRKHHTDPNSRAGRCSSRPNSARRSPHRTNCTAKTCKHATEWSAIPGAWATAAAARIGTRIASVTAAAPRSSLAWPTAIAAAIGASGGPARNIGGRADRTIHGSAARSTIVIAGCAAGAGIATAARTARSAAEDLLKQTAAGARRQKARQQPEK